MKNNPSGFTIVELVVVMLLVFAFAALLISQNSQFQQVERDRQSKTAINSIHHSLEEVYFQQNNHYPSKIRADILPTVEPSLFKDPAGIQIGETNSSYRYEPAGCQGEKCSSYLLYAELDNEARYEKRSPATTN